MGTQCGIMDQMVSACGSIRQAIFLDCESLQTKSTSFPNHTFIVIHSGSTRKLSQGTTMNEKRKLQLPQKL